MSFVAHLLFDNKTFNPDFKEVAVRSHRLLDVNKRPSPEKKGPVHARTRILAALNEFSWKTVSQIAEETGITRNTVFRTVDRMHKAKRLECKKKPSITGDVNLYRKK